MSVVLAVTLALSLVLAWTTAVGLSALASLIRSRLASRSPSTRWRAAAVLAPGAVAVAVLLVVLLPGPLAACHCFEHGNGHPHLCIRHPWLASPLLGFAAPIAIAWLAFAALRLLPILRELVKAELWSRELRARPAELIDGVEVRFVEVLGLGAFTVGLLQPLVVVDRDLWRQLSEVERLAIVHHEHAHASRGDALTQACLRVFSAVLPWSLAHAWLRAWRGATELACDRHAALRLKDAASVAAALVSVERLRVRGRGRHELVPALGVAAGNDLALRVRALLDATRSEPPPLTSDLRPIAAALLLLAAFLVAWPGGFLHHAAESLLGLLTDHH